MTTESMTLQGLYLISLSLTPTEKWNASSSFFAGASGGGVFTVLAIFSLIIAVVLLFWVFTRSKHSQHDLELKVRGLAVKNVRLRQENNRLIATNEKLLQENAELYQKQVEALENITNSETPTQETPELLVDKPEP
jgi:cell division protein FtsB